MKLYRFAVLFLLLLSVGCAQTSNPITADYPSEASVEAMSFNLINEERVKAGLPALVRDEAIANVARAHSSDMRDRNYFAHNDPSGQSPHKRLVSAGIPLRVSGENIARTMSITDPALFAHNGFLGDTAHRNVLLNRDFTRAGVGVARSGNDYWITQNFVGE